MKSGRTLIDLAKELERQLASKKDLIVPSGLMGYQTDAQGDCQVHVHAPGATESYGISEIARRQLADKLRIPYAYFERMRVEQPELLDRNVNTWLRSGNGEKRMVRTLDGRVRAVLSDRYRRLDNYDLADAVLPILQRLQGARFESVELTETRMYLEIVTPNVSHEVAPGDVVQAGVAISNSEVGHGTLTVQPLVFRLVCGNGLIASDRILKKTHVGRALHADEEGVIAYREDTLAAADRAFFLKVRDVVEAAVSQASLMLVAEKMRSTMGIRLMGNPVQSVEVLADRYAMTDSECSGVLRHLIEDGDLSGYGLVNAVTRYSQDVDDYDRATELEALGGRLIDMSVREWKELAEV